MSQGRRELAEPSLLTDFDQGRLYAHIPRRQFYERPGQLLDLTLVRMLTAGADPAHHSDQHTCLQRVDEAMQLLAELGLAPSVVVAYQGHHCGADFAGLDERGLVALGYAAAVPGPSGLPARRLRIPS